MDNSSKPKRLSKKSESLNEMIINYYNKFGENRDLEKYFRFRRNYNKHSSSESSLFSSTSTSQDCHFLQLKNQPNEKPLINSNEEHHSNRRNSDSCSADSNENLSSSGKNIDPTKKTTGRVTVENFSDENPQVIHIKSGQTSELEKQKSYSFNCESNIQICIPKNAVSMPNLATGHFSSSAITEGCQTDFEEINPQLVEENLSTLVEVDEEYLQTPKNNANKILQSKSPDSHNKSSCHKRLEWDSLGDVGYNKTSTKVNQKSLSMSTIERSVLKNFFSDRGIEICFPSPVQTKSEISLKQVPSTSQGAVPKLTKPKEKWRKTLESVKQKYNSSPALLIRQNAVTDDGKSETTDFSRFNVNNKSHSTPKSTDNLEKCCQTSLVGTYCKEIQCDFSNGGSIRSAFDAGSVTSQSSFEYCPTNVSKTSIERISDLSNKENILPKESMEKQFKKKFNDKDDLHTTVTKLLQMQENASQLTKYKEVELGIQLLCSLIQAKNLNDRQKRHLAKKIMTKITKTESSSLVTTTTGDSTKSNSISVAVSKKKKAVNENFSLDSKQKINISGINQTSQTYSSSSAMAKSSSTSSIAIENSNVLDDKFVKEKTSKKSAGQSEINAQSKLRLAKNKKISKSENLVQKTDQDEMIDSLEQSIKALSMKKDYSKKKRGVNVAAETSETSQEDQLVTMREWLDPLTKSEFIHDIKQKQHDGGGDFLTPSKQFLKSIDTEKNKHLNWIELEIQRLENLKKLLIAEKKFEEKILSNVREVSVQAMHNSNDNKVFKSDFVELFHHEEKSPSVVDSSSMSSEKLKIHREMSETDLINFKQGYQRSIQRIKENVIYDEVAPSIEIETKTIVDEKKFPKENYKQSRSKLETPSSSNYNASRPSSESICSFAQQKRREFIENYTKTHYDRPNVESAHYSEPRIENATSVKNDVYTATSSFIASPSMSIPGGSSSTTTTTHQYDSRCGIAVQTTDSILKTTPIFGTKCLFCKEECTCKTERVYYPGGKSRTVQVKPKSVAYVIKFDELANNCEELSAGNESLSLNERYERDRPEFLLKSIKRQKILNKIRKIRQERLKKIRDIVENTSFNSLTKKLNELPPPATKQCRVFTTKEMKAITKRQQEKFPEIIQKAENENNERHKKGNKILRDVFNERLKKRVRKGKLSLSHSATMI